MQKPKEKALRGVCRQREKGYHHLGGKKAIVMGVQRRMRILFIGYVCALLGMSLAAFVAFALDKGRARRGVWRVKERTLLLLCAGLGAPGGLLGMQLFRHKTQHWRFRLLVPMLALTQGILAGVLYAFS